MKNTVVTGGAGLVGTNLIKNFLSNGIKVFCVDNLTRGKLSNISEFTSNKNFTFIESDLSNINCDFFKYKFNNITDVWHLAANSDIRAGVENQNIDEKDTFQTTKNILQWSKKNFVREFYFASSSAIYGDVRSSSINELSGPYLPISNYGAYKLASEAIISATAHTSFEKCIIYRFPNVVGNPLTHGILYDFRIKLNNNSAVLHVLGNGSQKKQYIHVTDLISGLIHVQSCVSEKINIINIGPNDNGITVKEIAELTCSILSPRASIKYGKENFGWVGDVPSFQYSLNKINELGWSAKYTSREAILLTLELFR